MNAYMSVACLQCKLSFFVFVFPKWRDVSHKNFIYRILNRSSRRVTGAEKMYIAQGEYYV